VSDETDRDEIGEWYARQRREAERLADMLARETDPDIRRLLKKKLNLARYVGD
jgi:hypothetical protein